MFNIGDDEIMARRSDHSRDEIRGMALAAAEEILEAEGVPGLTARKVADAIGYTVGTLYLVFRNLDDLILHLNARTLADLRRAMERAAKRCRQAGDCVPALGRAYIRYAMEHPHRWSLVFEHRLPEGECVPEWLRQEADALFALVQRHLEPVAPACSAREIRDATRALWSGVHGICILSLTDKLGMAGEGSPRELADTLIRNYLAGWHAQRQAKTTKGERS